MQAFNEGYSVDDIHSLTAIDKWYLYKLKGMLDIEKELSESKRFAAC
jgi:hypothetical protein